MTEPERPILTVCVPTYRRPDMLARTLASITPIVDRPGDVEVVISDNAPEVSHDAATNWLAGWPGPSRYLANPTDIGAIANFNQCIEQAAGRYVMLLHDDDFLLAGALRRILAVIAEREDARCLLFGVDVVDVDGRLLRRQGGRVSERLSPQQALRQVLTNSSLVRIPALVVERAAIIEVGGFDESVGNPTDFDLFVRLFGRFGLTVVDETISAYTVHDAAQTSSMFRPDMIETLMSIFDRATAMGVLPEAAVRRCQVEWFHQFVLGGAYRHLRIGENDEAARILALLDLPAPRQLGRSRRWHWIRTIFSVLVRLPPWVSRGLSAGSRRAGVERRIWTTL
jgi:glycosyltransferase involved in cell wall biosynthesis